VDFISFLKSLMGKKSAETPNQSLGPNCPTCGVPLHYCGYEREGCAQCRGLWLGSLEGALSGDDLPYEDEFGFRGKDLGHTFSPSPTSRGCPACGKAMKNQRYRESEIWVDYCPDGHGVWLDGGEFWLLWKYPGLREQVSSEHRARVRADYFREQEKVHKEKMVADLGYRQKHREKQQSFSKQAQFEAEISEMFLQENLAEVFLGDGFRLRIDLGDPTLNLVSFSESVLLRDLRDLGQLVLDTSSHEGDVKSHSVARLQFTSDQGELIAEIIEGYTVYDEPGPSWNIPRKIEANSKHLAERLGVPLSSQ
jgi:Zn-finger nucleic acid-binding protein